MTAPGPVPAEKSDSIVSIKQRESLHRQLDRLLDQRNIIAEKIGRAGWSRASCDSLDARANDCIKRVVLFACDVAGASSRAIAFHKYPPDSRAAFAHFLTRIADFAAPDSIAKDPRDFSTFKRADVLRRLDDLHSLDYGITPPRLQPTSFKAPVRSSYALAKERFRAVQWVEYLASNTKYMAARHEVAAAYDVSTKTLHNWRNEALPNVSREVVDLILETARIKGRHGERPEFTLAPIAYENNETAADMLRYDADRYKKLK